jgi:replication initiation and membrane attachment protein DnaB
MDEDEISDISDDQPISIRINNFKNHKSFRRRLLRSMGRRQYLKLEKRMKRLDTAEMRAEMEAEVQHAELRHPDSGTHPPA